MLCQEDDTLAEFAAPLPCVPLFTDIFTKVSNPNRNLFKTD